MTARDRIEQRRNELAMLVAEYDSMLEVLDADEAEAGGEAGGEEEEAGPGESASGPETPEAGDDDDDEEEEEEEPKKRPDGPSPERNGKAHAAEGPASPKDAAALRIRDLLAKEGPLGTGQIAAKLGKNPETISYHFKNRPEWFVKSNPSNRLSPWTLTEQGRSAG